MGLPTAIIYIPFILITIASLVISGFAWHHRRSPGSLGFTLVLTGVAIWLTSDALKASTNLIDEKILWTRIGFLGIIGIGSSWLLFCLAYVYPARRNIERLAIFISIVPTITFFLALTNDLHHWIWTDFTLDNRQNLICSYGLGFWIFLVYFLALIAVGSYILVKHGIRIYRSSRWRAALIAAGIAIPWIAGFVFITRGGLLRDINPTPMAMSLACAVFTWMIYRQGFFDRFSHAHTAILENIGDGYLVLNAHHRIVEASPVACRWLRLNSETITGRAAEDVFKDWPSLLNLLGSPDQQRTEISVAGEEEKFLEIDLKTWQQGERNNKGVILFLRDVTKRKQIELQMRQSERLFRLVINSSPVGIVITNETGLITYASPKVYDLFQVAPETNFLGHSVLQWVHPEDRTIAVMRMMGAIDEQVEQPPLEYRFLRTDSSYFWSEISSVPIIDDQGLSTGMLSIFRDVSSRKALEIRLQRNLEQQTFINNLLQILYRPHNLEDALEQVLQRAGDFFYASRVYICRDSTDGLETSISIEWASAEMKQRARESVLVRYGEIPTWKVWMNQFGMVLAPDSLSVPEDLVEFMTTWNVISMIALPVYGSEEQLYGFLGIDYCNNRYDWPEEELDVLWNVCRIVSAAVAQRQIEEAERRQRSLAEALHDTAVALNSTLNLDEVLDRVLANLEKVVPHESASIALLDDDDGTFYFVRWRGFNQVGDDWLRAARMPLTERSTYMEMAETRQPVIISDTWIDRRWAIIEEHSHVRSYAGAPIIIHGKLVGFINLDSTEPEHFTSDLIYSLNVFADQAAIAIANARLYNEAHRRAEEMGSLYHIGMTLTAGLEMEQVLLSLFEQIKLILPADVFYVSTYDEETQVVDLPLYVETGEFMKIEPRSLLTDPGITGEVIRSRKTINLPDTQLPDIAEKYHLIHRGGRACRSYVGVPLIVLDRVVGVVSMQSYQANAYSPDQVRLLETIATQAAIAIQNARLYHQMKQMAITDPVTQLFTRRQFIFLGRSEVERAIRYKRSVSVLMVDIDFFKKVNDTYGHSAGDQVLFGVAKICREAMRNTDIIGRWGGEEFSIVLPEADRIGASLIAERIRRMVASTFIPVAKDQVMVTVSIGVATLDQDNCTLEILIDQADRAMYKAKAGGRNQVQFFLE